jgi:hypothetical protein
LTALAGDGELRAVAQTEQMPCFGILWLLDQMFGARTLEAAVLIAGIEAIAIHPRCRLPRAEIQSRLERYSAR